jgi:pantoate--beta-alanine ligase
LSETHQQLLQKMLLFKKINDLHNWLETQLKKGNTVGFAPTMGALHPGHISLINASRQQHPVTVCSIFVNPTQFNDPADFKKYPITLDTDIYMLEEAGCDVLFLPSVDEMYPDGISGNTHYELGYLETIFEGKYRPGHFQGVCQVVHRLLDIVKPDSLYLGQKDYQQCQVIKKLVTLVGFAEKINVTICPTLREQDGLAMSSRNLRLSPDERALAPEIYRTLLSLKNNIHPGSVDQLLSKAKTHLEESGFKPDYLSIAAAENLAPVNEWDGHKKIVVLVAAFLHEIRLIDNLPLN